MALSLILGRGRSHVPLVRASSCALVSRSPGGGAVHLPPRAKPPRRRGMATGPALRSSRRGRTP
eukprot:3129994-Pyramimonas_sp.AAC.1